MSPDDRLVYRLPKPMPDGRAILHLTPLELLDRLALLHPSAARTTGLDRR